MSVVVVRARSVDGAASLEAAVYAALDEVVDPELDESIVQLGFIERVEVHGHGRVTIHLRLPTFWCSPSFAYLMAHDAREAALQIEGVEHVRLVLADHAHSDEISQGVSAGLAFEDVFPDETDGNLDELRARFRAKAFGMRQEQLLRALVDFGLGEPEVLSLRLGDVLDSTDATGLRLRVGSTQRLIRGAASLARAYLVRRERIGLGVNADAWLIIRLDGTAVPPDGLEAYLKMMRKQRVSMTFNAMMCRGLLETRYGLEPARKEDTR